MNGQDMTPAIWAAACALRARSLAPPIPGGGRVLGAGIAGGRSAKGAALAAGEAAQAAHARLAAGGRAHARAPAGSTIRGAQPCHHTHAKAHDEAAKFELEQLIERPPSATPASMPPRTSSKDNLFRSPPPRIIDARAVGEGGENRKRIKLGFEKNVFSPARLRLLLLGPS